MMLKKLLSFALIVLAGLAVPSLAAAGTLNPIEGNAWTLYVFGNGDAIFNILNSIKLLMMPDNGDTGFNSLMMFLATLGFLVLAIQAGFDPGKNLVKMFGYIIMVGTVHIMTMQITANIHISDPVTNYDNVVPGVPALVGVPAAIVSEVGHWLTKTAETYYSIPSEMTVSGGEFNLFGRLMETSNDFVISNPELKRSLSAYVADCVVPAMAMGKLSASDLVTSPVMTDTLAKATNEAILTKYWPNGIPSTSGHGIDYPTVVSYKGTDYPVQGGLGAVIPCAAAWNSLSTDLDNHANDLMAGTAQQWSKTGVLVPFEQGMSAAMALASNGGANAFANYSKPQGYILQQAMLNSMNGSFRQAAASIGNNDVLMAASIAQAEQSQKSSWFTAARVFGNMMGYVYTTLQAFIFAIVPIVIVSLMVPGLGRSIFVNYSQILVWLALWQPMLSIVNFLITVFGKAQIGSTLELATGVTMQNKWALTQSTNDLMLAAQFLGTSVPLLAWGLVKGSMAFTEFISHGIGSSMAQQAGATAATGNTSMGNLSMDNTSMNKFNTAMSSAVGNQTTMGYTGAMQTANDRGGPTDAINGGVMTRMATIGMTQAQAANYNTAISATESAGKTLSHLSSAAVDDRKSLDSVQSMQKMLSAVQGFSAAYTAATQAGDHAKAAEARQSATEVALAMSKTAQSGIKIGVQGEYQMGGIAGQALKQVSGMGVKVTGGVDASLSGATNSVATDKALSTMSQDLSFDLNNSYGSSKGSSSATSAGTTSASSASSSRSHGESLSDNRSAQELISSAAARASALQHSLTSTLQEGVTMSAYQRVNAEDQVDALSKVNSNTGNNVNAALDSAKKETEAGAPAPTAGAFDALKSNANNAYNNSPAAKVKMGPGPSATPAAPAGSGEIAKQSAALKQEVEQKSGKAKQIVNNGADAYTNTKDKIQNTSVVFKGVEAGVQQVTDVFSK